LQYPEKFLASFAEGTLVRIALALGDKEDARSLIRDAVERELKRRARAKP
jgi:hypothetical protein